MRSFFRFLCGVLASLALPGSSLALSLDEAFAQLKFYDAGQSNTALVFIDHYVARVSADATQRRELATRLAALLADTGASEPAKLFVCQQLRVVASDTQVPQVAAMLDDAKTADLARLVLQPMPGPAASRALLEALGRVQGEPLIGVINSIGDRQDAGAVQPLGGFLGNTNPKLLRLPPTRWAKSEPLKHPFFSRMPSHRLDFAALSSTHNWSARNASQPPVRRRRRQRSTARSSQRGSRSKCVSPHFPAWLRQLGTMPCHSFSKP